MKNFTKEQVEFAFSKANSKIEKTARILGVRNKTAKNLLIQFQIPFEITNNKMKNVSKEELEKAYNEEITLKSLAKRFKISIGSLEKHLYKYNIHIPLHHSSDHNFFSRETEEAYYWAGFIAADGCVINNNLKINITASDKLHLEQFKKDLQCTQKITTLPAREVRFGERKIISKESVAIEITSQQIIKDLKEKFNIVPNKSLIYSIPQNLHRNILIRHFIRGLIDGDGSWYISVCGRQKNKVRLKLTGTKDVCEFVHGEFKTNNLISNDFYPQKGNGNFWEINFQSDHSLIKIRNFLYKDATRFLQRKFDAASKIENFIEIYPFQEIPNLKEVHKQCEGNRNEMSKILGVSQKKINYGLNKIEYDKIQRTKINENFFKEDHYYWFGKLYDKIAISFAGGIYALRICDSIQNLERINKAFEAEYQIYPKTDKRTSNELSFYSNILGNDFLNFKKNIFVDLNNKSTNQIIEFIQGYVDSSGSFVEKRHPRNKNRLFLITGDENFLVFFQSLIKNTLNIDCILNDELTENNRNKLLFDHENTIKLFDKLYSYSIQDIDLEVKLKSIKYKEKFKNLSGTEFIKKQRESKFNSFSKEDILNIAKISKSREEIAFKLNITYGGFALLQKKFNLQKEISNLLRLNR